MAHTLKRDDLSPPLDHTLAANGRPIDLSGAASVTFSMRQRHGSKLVEGDAIILQSDTSDVGLVRYVWVEGDTDTVGAYDAEFVIDWGPTGKETIPSDGYLEVLILGDLTPGGAPPVVHHPFALVLYSVANVAPEEPVAVALGDVAPELADPQSLATPDRVDLTTPAGVIWVQYFAFARVDASSSGTGIWPDLRIDGERVQVVDAMQFVDPYATGGRPLSVSPGVNAAMVQLTSDLPLFIDGSSILEPPALPIGAWMRGGAQPPSLVPFEVGPGAHTVEVLWVRDSDVADAADIRDRRLIVLA